MNVSKTLSTSVVVVSKFLNKQDLPAANRAGMALTNILPTGTKIYIGPEWQSESQFLSQSSLPNPFIFASSMGFSVSGHSFLVPNPERITVSVKRLAETPAEFIKSILSSNFGYEKAMAQTKKAEDIIKAGEEAFSQLA